MLKSFTKIATAGMIVALSTASSLSAVSVQSFTVTGTIPTKTSIPVDNLVGGDKVLFTTITDNDFANDEIIITNGIQLSGVRTNKPIFLAIQKNQWDVPVEYDSTNGSKKADGSDSDLLVQVNSGTLASANGHISAVGNYATAYQAVTNTADNMIKLGEITGGKSYGCKNATIDIDVKILLDPVYDVPGTYVAHLELTISDQ